MQIIKASNVPSSVKRFKEVADAARHAAGSPNGKPVVVRNVMGRAYGDGRFVSAYIVEGQLRSERR